LLDFLLRGLCDAGCTILSASDPGYAPFFISFETPGGERSGVLAYAFFANSRLTRNRPEDEHRFQVKYGSDTKAALPVEQDPARLVTTIFVGIDPEAGVLVGADPCLHDGTRMFISIEFKRADVEQIRRSGWHVWERQSHRRVGQPVETLVGVRRDRVLDFIRFERAAFGLDQGHRQLLAERMLPETRLGRTARHDLITELGLPESALLDLINQTGRLKMAVRGWVAEVHLEDMLRRVPGVDECRRLTAEGSPDIEVRYRGRLPILVECKNVLRAPTASGLPRLDFQRTRAAMADPCSRYYRPSDFEVLAACLHARTERWDFRFAATRALPAHEKCQGRLKAALTVDASWHDDPEVVLDMVTST
jgi:hypothetical protein